MGFIDKKFKQLQDNDKLNEAFKVTSDTATDIIKKLGASGESEGYQSKLIDNFIVFTGMSGGTGVTTVVSNIAYSASQQGMRVCVIDMNIQTPLQHTFLNIKQEIKEKPDLVSLLLGKANLSECINSEHEYSLIYSNNRTIIDYLRCNTEVAVTNFLSVMDKLRGLFDIILVDCPMNMQDLLINHVLYACDTMYVVWDEGVASIVNTDKLRRDLSISGIDAYAKMRVILNKRTNIHYTNYPFKKLNLEVVGILPFDTAIIESSLKAQIFCEKGSSNSKNAALFSNGIDEITTKILKIGGLIK